ncbi:MAG: histone [Promethearchaeota archaeon]
MSRDGNKYFFPTAIRRLMKQFGAGAVSKGSVEGLIGILEERSREVTAYAVKLAKHANRKRVTKEDILLAIEYVQEKYG